ncbi:MAG: hypothetical protein V4760_12400 [Bdellovibrionota bacterium]
MANENNGSKKPSSIDDALKVLDEALSGVNPPALDALVSDEYQNLKGALGQKAQQTTAPAQDFIGNAVRGFTESFGGVAGPIGEYSAESYEKIAEVAAVGLEEARRIGGEVDRSVRANPWPYLGGIAVGTLALGVILGRSHTTPTTRI